jgi:hypothetical protein
MKRYLICLGFLLSLSGCRSIQQAHHDAHFRLTDDGVSFVVQNHGTTPFTITSLYGHVYHWRNFVESNGEVGVGVSAPGFAIGTPRVVAPGQTFDVQVPQNMFRRPDKNGKTIVRVNYRCGHRQHHRSFEIEGRNYIDEKLIHDRLEKKRKENVTTDSTVPSEGAPSDVQ